MRRLIPCRTIDKVDTTMADIQEQTQLANEVSEAISANTYAGVDIDEVRRPFRYCLTVYLHSCRRSSRPNWRVSRMRSLTNVSWVRITSPYIIQAGQLQSKNVSVALRPTSA